MAYHPLFWFSISFTSSFLGIKIAIAENWISIMAINLIWLQFSFFRLLLFPEQTLYRLSVQKSYIFLPTHTTFTMLQTDKLLPHLLTTSRSYLITLTHEDYSSICGMLTNCCNFFSRIALSGNCNWYCDTSIGDIVLLIAYSTTF